MRGIRPGVDRRDALKGAVALALGLGSFPTVSRAQAKLGTTFDEMVAGARTEGRVVAWITSPHGSKAQQALIDAFNARFGLKTKLEWVPNNPVTSNTRAIVEMAGGGGVSVDIIGAGAIEEVATAANAKLVKPFAWSAVLGAAMPALKDVEDHMIPVFRGDAIPYQLIAYGLCWNPNSINEADLPNKFTDLTDPRFAGKFAFNSFLAPLEITSYVNGPDETIAIAKKLFNNGPVFERGTPAVASAVVTGAVPFGVTNSQVAETSQRNNDPLKFRLFSDVIPLSQVHLLRSRELPKSQYGTPFRRLARGGGQRCRRQVRADVACGRSVQRPGKDDRSAKGRDRRQDRAGDNA